MKQNLFEFKGYLFTLTNMYCCEIKCGEQQIFLPESSTQSTYQLVVEKERVVVGNRIEDFF